MLTIAPPDPAVIILFPLNEKIPTSPIVPVNFPLNFPVLYFDPKLSAASSIILMFLFLQNGISLSTNAAFPQIWAIIIALIVFPVFLFTVLPLINLVFFFYKINSFIFIDIKIVVTIHKDRVNVVVP